jgi:hypothetical protein
METVYRNKMTRTEKYLAIATIIVSMAFVITFVYAITIFI